MQARAGAGAPPPFVLLAARLPVVVGYWALPGRELSALALQRAAASHAEAAVAAALAARVTAPPGGSTDAGAPPLSY